MLFVICEDNQRDRTILAKYLERYSVETETQLASPLLFSHTDELLYAPAALNADAMFLDIMMEGENGPAPLGVSTAQHMRQMGYKGAIVFITSSDGYYPDGFEVGASHYLLKPITYERFLEAVGRVVKKELKRPVILLPMDRAQTEVPVDSIRFVEVYDHHTMLHTEAGTLTTTLPLKDVESLLNDDGFLRCFRSYIINMAHVKKMGEDHFLMDNGQKVPISLRERKSIKSKYLAWCFSAMRGGKED